MVAYVAAERVLMEDESKARSHKRKIEPEPLFTREVAQSNLTTPCILVSPVPKSSTNTSSWQPVSSMSCSSVGCMLDNLQPSSFAMVDDTLGQDASSSGGASSSYEALAAHSVPLPTLHEQKSEASAVHALQHASGLPSLVNVNEKGYSFDDQEDRNGDIPERIADQNDEQPIAPSLAEDNAVGGICSVYMGLFCRETLEGLADTPTYP